MFLPWVTWGHDTGDPLHHITSEQAISLRDLPSSSATWGSSPVTRRWSGISMGDDIVHGGRLDAVWWFRSYAPSSYVSWVLMSLIYLKKYVAAMGVVHLDLQGMDLLLCIWFVGKATHIRDMLAPGACRSSSPVWRSLKFYERAFQYPKRPKQSIVSSYLPPTAWCHPSTPYKSLQPTFYTFS
jgi:hypothetical protein